MTIEQLRLALIKAQDVLSFYAGNFPNDDLADWEVRICEDQGDKAREALEFIPEISRDDLWRITQQYVMALREYQKHPGSETSNQLSLWLSALIIAVNAGQKAEFVHWCRIENS